MKGSEREGEGRQRAKGRRTGRTTDDASSSVSAKVAFVTDPNEGLRTYVGITNGTKEGEGKTCVSHNGAAHQLTNAPFSVALFTETTDGWQRRVSLRFK